MKKSYWDNFKVILFLTYLSLGLYLVYFANKIIESVEFGIIGILFIILPITVVLSLLFIKVCYLAFYKKPINYFSYLLMSSILIFFVGFLVRRELHLIF